VGVGEIYNLVLGPQTVTNISFPVKMINDKDHSDSSTGISNNSSSHSNNDIAFKNIVMRSCIKDANKDSEETHKDIVVYFDLMPTIKIYNYPVVTLAFTGQKTILSCDKVGLLI
jgi:hypothetical protein